jgi:DNA-binding LacI/PurR family transcriptional regulator
MPNQARRPATMRDVAARAGVSRSLVSTVFRGVPGASPATRARVLAAAEELGYRPDDRARSLRSRDRRLIGITLTAVNPFHVAVTQALHQDAELRGYQLAMSWTTESRSLAQAVDLLLAQRCAALIHIGPTVPEDEMALLVDMARHVPTVVVDRFLDLPNVDTLRIDDTAALAITVGHVANLGHRDIWYLDGGSYVSAVPRREGYLAAMRSLGLSDLARLVPSGGTRAAGATSGLALLAAGDLPTAIVAYNDLAALGLMDVLSRRGVQVPADVSVIGFDNIPEADQEHLALTTVEQRADLLAVATAEAVMARLDGGPAGGLHLLAPGPLVVRGSTARPRTESE